MAHSYFRCIMHVVFSTKQRRKIIPTAMQERLWSYTAAICQKRDIFVHAIGGTENHIHLLLQFHAPGSQSDQCHQGEFVRMDVRLRPFIRLAKGLRRFQREQIERRHGSALYPKSGTPS